MAGSTLWLYLTNGRGDVKLTDAWNGADPVLIGTVDANGDWNDDGGQEAGDPYRDIFFAAGVTVRKNGNVIGEHATTPSITSVRLTTPVLTAGASSGFGGGLTGDLVATDSDEKSHTPPRQYLKVCTWHEFTEYVEGGGDGPKLRVRTASIEGWGRNPRV
jgi:hypothetical protein